MRADSLKRTRTKTFIVNGKILTPDMRVLLIEDDAMFGKALVRGLKRNGMTVDWTRNGTDGLAAMHRS